MRFFITGASSFIGVEVCRYLSDLGHDVIAMSRRINNQLVDISRNEHLEVFRSDLQTLPELAKHIKADVFIHFAWAGTTHEERNNPAVHEENVRHSLECVKIAKRMGCRLYVDAGSQAEYGIVQGVINEETPCNPVSAYGKGKLKMYEESRILTEKLGLKYIHLRIFSVYGENDHDETLIKSSLKKLKTGETIELRGGDQKWNYVYVRDAASQIAELSLYAIKKKDFSCEIYNIASNDTRQLKDFVMAMKNIACSSSELKFGGYDKAKDVNLNPDTKKVSFIVYPLMKNIFEDIIKRMI